ncbi:MAG: transposase [Patescibacteria group bacterium]
MPRFSAEDKKTILNELKSPITVTDICKKWQISRFSFYQWKKRMQEGSLENRFIRGSRHHRSLKPNTTEKIVDIICQNPKLSHTKLWNEAQKKGIKVSYGGIQSLLTRNNLSTYLKRTLYSSNLPPIFSPSQRGKISADARLAYIKEVLSRQSSITGISRRYHISRFTLYKWLREYQAGRKIDALTPHYKSGQDHYKALPQDKTIAVLDAVINNPALSVRKLHPLLIAKNIKLSYGSVQTILN